MDGIDFKKMLGKKGFRRSNCVSNAHFEDALPIQTSQMIPAQPHQQILKLTEMAS